MSIDKLNKYAEKYTLANKIIEKREESRLSFISKFPLNELKNLTLDEFAQGGNENSFCYWLEYREIGFGIGGGNASKFGIYKPRNNGKLVYVTGFRTNKIYLDENEAKLFYSQLLSKIIKALDYTSRDKIEKISNLEIPMYNMVLLKILSLYFPGKFISIGSSEVLIRCAKEIEIENIELNSKNLIQINYECNKHLRKEKHCQNWHHHKLSEFIWGYFDGENLKRKRKSKKQYWLYSPGQNANQWHNFYQENIMGLGWDDIGDLSQFQSRDEIKKALVAAYGGTSSKSNDVSANDDFLNKINIGDIVIVKKGRGGLLGYGEVVSGYSYDKTRNNFNHIRKVDWKLKGNWDVDFNLASKTLTDITKYDSDNPKYDSLSEELLGIMGVEQLQKDYKESFTKWLTKKYGENSGTANSYIRAIGILSQLLSKEIFKTSDVIYLDVLYKDLITEQGNPEGKYYNSDTPSYGNNGFYSASIKSYLDFLKTIPSNKTLLVNQTDLPKILEIFKPQNNFDIHSFQSTCKEAGLVYTDKLLIRFVSSLLTKPFVILTGLSGSGKTKLAQAFVQWICQEKSQYRIVPVGADWTNREPLLGYPNALKPGEYVNPDSGVIDLVLNANSNPSLPFFLILDEMNLSHVERYFADFLSVMESNEEIPLYADYIVDIARDDNNKSRHVPSKLKVPSNLFIIGTVNIDETTNMFSPKVLDRANTIEFRINSKQMEGFLGKATDIDMQALQAKGINMAQDFITQSNKKQFTNNNESEINVALLKFFNELQKTGAEFGYRSASEILRLIGQLGSLDSTLTTDEKIDIAIIQKLLPKLHGSRRKLTPILEALGKFCLSSEIKIVQDVFEKYNFEFYSIKEGKELKPAEGVKYPLSLEKISRMYRGAIDNGFASYAEA